MNPKMLMFGVTFAVIAGVTNAFITPVVTGLSVSLPLLTATEAGQFFLPLAVLGVIKLAAAAAVATGHVGTSLIPSVPVPVVGGEEEGFAFSRHSSHYRQKRSADEAAGEDAVFGLVSSMDMYSCGKALVCGLKAKNEATLANDEILILSLFADRKGRKTVNPASPKAEYDLAAELGLATHDEVACRKRYATCPYTTEEMMMSLRQSNL